ncbi:hypothetical protein K210_04705 [Erysipelothrix rhusiopathiae SY1027]|uniref:hypothetical protein n=1 Tax=Erysipelothrix rhusiopathiae TaxID=1648 RepID=UPI0003348D3E|nr:hypothetical protein [Erysipelothrix rhusiopathiae]AGN24544.1 hypothetical protein K210_04705 [Erysipelothrix rhusiopathiae SY1027]
MSENINLVYGFIYDKNGMYDKKWVFENTPENIASFIINNKSNRCTITNEADTLILTSTIGGYVDICPNQDYLTSELLPVLIPMQIGEENSHEIEFIPDELLYEMEI